MLKTLHRRLKRWIYRRDYQRMERLAATCNYGAAALLAVCLGEVELMRRYEALERMTLAVRYTAPMPDNPFARCSMEYRLRERRN